MAFAAGHFVHQRFADVWFKERARVRVKYHGTIAFDDEKFTLYGSHHLTEGVSHRGQIEMKSERSLQPAFG